MHRWAHINPKNSDRESNSTPHPDYEYLSVSSFLITLTLPNKQPFRVKSVFKSCDHVSNS